MKTSDLPASFKGGRIRVQLLHALRVLSTIEFSTKARGDAANQQRAELAARLLQEALLEVARAEHPCFPAPVIVRDAR